MKRFFRIYVPYILSFFVALMLLSLSPKLGGPLPYLSDFYNQRWTHGISMDIIVEHVLGIVNVHTMELNDAYWSLVHEMRISIFFPFVVLLLRKVRWQYTGLIGIALFTLAVLNEVFGFQKSNGLNTTYLHSMHYLSFFIYGMFLAKHRSEIVKGFQALKRRYKYGILVFSLICYNSSYAVVKLLAKLGIDVTFERIFREQIIAIGVIGFVIIALSSKKIGSALRSPIPIFLGNISYSLYLYHMVIYLALMHAFLGVIPLPYLLILAFVVSMAVAYVGWLVIEKPTMAIGKRIADRIQKRTSIPIQRTNLNG
ncbi:acyltransferase family protein [Cohnella cholangitidis]|uniref:acyltransferase family protein n=1 Tax=Cohnella cholangitidis TaxID=2598458 RepID=UPI0015FAA4FD|nr:acyltransferase [Cohnella cholangitidis]